MLAFFLISKYNVKGKIGIVTLALLIIISTLFVKQHFIFDVIAALLICIISNIIESLFNIYGIFKKKKII